MPKTVTQPVLALLLAAALVLPQRAAADPDAGAYLAGRIAGAGSDYRAAGMWFTRALLSDPGNLGLMESAIISRIALGEIEPAAAIAAELAGAGGESQPAIIALLADQAKRGDFAGLLEDGAAGRGIGLLIDGLVAAWAELGTGRMSEALSGFDTLAATDGMEAFGLYHKALALASVGDFEGADAILSGREGGALRVMRRGTVAHAQILSQLERNDQAIAVLDQAFGNQQDPGIDALRARLRAGETLPYDVAVNATDGLAEVFFTLATALNGEAEDGYTLLYARVAAHLRPDHTEALLLSAGLLSAQGQHDLAAETYAAIPPADPAFHVAEIGRAEALRASGKTEAALEVLQALTRSHGDLMTVHLALGDMLRREERYAEAAAAYDLAIARIGTPQRQHWSVFYSRGIAHERQKQWPEAEADFRRALELEPDQPQVLNYLGYSFVEKGENLDEALAMIERAVAARPDAGYIQDSLAWAYFQLGRYADSVAPMERASVLEPVDPVVTDHLGDVYWAVGRRLEAQFQWRRALSFEPTEAEATRIRKKLDVGLDAVRAEEGLEPVAVDVTEDDATEDNGG
ncbi:tetratricopeptide repeat protein [Fertoebacter nigrum]|uniref:Tetratricopeptide repeat protein n=1 Tax=Fertoeibacter niger TaxID=2656921 RepID=A0A8X8KR32_9RHOB|nr:tetratricopeptide repeat protein [Fertoeibacter niger]